MEKTELKKTIGRYSYWRDDKRLADKTLGSTECHGDGSCGGDGDCG